MNRKQFLAVLTAPFVARFFPKVSTGKVNTIYTGAPIVFPDWNPVTIDNWQPITIKAFSIPIECTHELAKFHLAMFEAEKIEQARITELQRQFAQDFDSLFSTDQRGPAPIPQQNDPMI